MRVVTYLGSSFGFLVTCVFLCCHHLAFHDANLWRLRSHNSSLPDLNYYDNEYKEVRLDSIDFSEATDSYSYICRVYNYFDGLVAITGKLLCDIYKALLNKRVKLTTALVDFNDSYAEGVMELTGVEVGQGSSAPAHVLRAALDRLHRQLSAYESDYVVKEMVAAYHELDKRLRRAVKAVTTAINVIRYGSLDAVKLRWVTDKFECLNKNLLSNFEASLNKSRLNYCDAMEKHERQRSESTAALLALTQARLQGLHDEGNVVAEMRFSSDSPQLRRRRKRDRLLNRRCKNGTAFLSLLRDTLKSVANSVTSDSDDIVQPFREEVVLLLQELAQKFRMLCERSMISDSNQGTSEYSGRKRSVSSQVSTRRRSMGSQMSTHF